MPQYYVECSECRRIQMPPKCNFRNWVAWFSTHGSGWCIRVLKCRLHVKETEEAQKFLLDQAIHMAVDLLNHVKCGAWGETVDAHGIAHDAFSPRWHETWSSTMSRERRTSRDVGRLLHMIIVAWLAPSDIDYVVAIQSNSCDTVLRKLKNEKIVCICQLVTSITCGLDSMLTKTEFVRINETENEIREALKNPFFWTLT